MIPNPIHRVLSTLCSEKVRYLLMGGQACVFYGAAEFSRDTDIVILSDSHNLQCLTSAMKKLKAKCIAVPAFLRKYLDSGHAVHFRCYRPDVRGMRIDVMSVMRGVASFEELWERRATVRVGAGNRYELMSLADLVQAKKTQRDKDWPMIRRLIEAHYVEYGNDPRPEQVSFWLKESRTASLLLELAERYPLRLDSLTKERSLLAFAKKKNESRLQSALDDEERKERELDAVYWKPLKKELEQLRHKKAAKTNIGSSKDIKM